MTCADQEALSGTTGHCEWYISRAASPRERSASGRQKTPQPSSARESLILMQPGCTMSCIRMVHITFAKCMNILHVSVDQIEILKLVTENPRNLHCHHGQPSQWCTTLLATSNQVAPSVRALICRPERKTVTNHEASGVSSPPLFSTFGSCPRLASSTNVSLFVLTLHTQQSSSQQLQPEISCQTPPQPPLFSLRPSSSTCGTDRRPPRRARLPPMSLARPRRRPWANRRALPRPMLPLRLPPIRSASRSSPACSDRQSPPFQARRKRIARMRTAARSRL